MSRAPVARLGWGVAGVALLVACSDIVPLDDPRWEADAELLTFVAQRGESMEVVVDAQLGCAAMTSDTVAVIANIERDLDAGESRPEDCEAACGSCGGIGPARPLVVESSNGDVATGFRSADGEIFAVAQGTLAIRTLTLARDAPVAAGSLLDLRWSVPTDVLSIREVSASQGGEPEAWLVSTSEGGVISVQVPAAARPGTWRITVPTQSVDANVTLCDAALCAVRIRVDELAIFIEVSS